jgi:predicted PurR-regulated permease PerM
MDLSEINIYLNTTMPTPIQFRAQLWAAAILFSLGLWILHGFLGPIAWAVIIALTTWPLLIQIRKILPFDHNHFLPPLILTLSIAGILFGPVTYGLIQLGQETQSLVSFLQEAQHNGISPPEWVGRLPMIGSTATLSWIEWLGTSDSVRETLKYILTSDWLVYTRQFAAQVFHRYASAFFSIVVLFFVYWRGDDVAKRVLLLCVRVFGDEGSRYARHAASAVRATVNGIVLVALGQGIALGFGYATAGLQHAMLLGVVTGVIAFVPFAAKLMFIGASTVLFAEGHTAQGLGLLIYGLLIILTADNYLRPKLIGNAVKLPFIWTLLGILGGIETFGLLGLFLGPTIMAILISVWRDCFDDAKNNRAQD